MTDANATNLAERTSSSVLELIGNTPLVRLNRVNAAVARRVVDDDDLVAGVATVAQQRLDALPDDVLVVVAEDDHADRRPGHGLRERRGPDLPGVAAEERLDLRGRHRRRAGARE